MSRIKNALEKFSSNTFYELVTAPLGCEMSPIFGGILQIGMVECIGMQVAFNGLSQPRNCPSNGVFSYMWISKKYPYFPT